MNLMYIQLIIIIIAALLGFISSANKKKKEDESKPRPVRVNNNYQTVERKKTVVLKDNIIAATQKEKSTKAKYRPLGSDDTKGEDGYMHEKQEHISALGFDADELVKAVVYNEILSPPKAYRRVRRGIR